ncbi:amidohydrolase [Marinimicrobium sp. ABcell2]|uniref:amidohydrolase n=1 Tax=Marinimicrobium sp. ABcell2 TaxID=3069751 RepID=UPI0027AE8EE0|nr:amidohydrolase [Marinimicrobium sp. ABcell2]MDQ2075523.1 amidohydrolase [Marinimicrobium sp. ABcell2]
MNNLRVALIQSAIVARAPEANLQWYEEQMAGAQGCDLLVLPEVFTTGFSASARDYAESVDGRAYQWMADQAQKLGAVVTGSLVVLEAGRYVNRLVWMPPDGRYRHYDKRHLFRMAGEHQRFAMGRERVLVELRGWRILPLVCYDLRFPVWSRNRNDYDLALYVANWPAARALHWQRLLQARAIENLSYVVGVNRIGQDDSGQAYQGDTGVYGPGGEVLLEAGDEPGCFCVELDASRLSEYRASFPAHLDADHFDLKMD